MSWNAKYERSDSGMIFATYQVQFGRKVRSFKTLDDVEAYLKTDEFRSLAALHGNPRVVHVITEIVGFVKDGAIYDI